jgi:hypothetical protein
VLLSPFSTSGGRQKITGPAGDVCAEEFYRTLPRIANTIVFFLKK